MRTAIALLLSVIALAAADQVTLVLPAGMQVRIVHLTNAPAPEPPMPMSVQMRKAAQQASAMNAPWTQRFIVTKVDPEARTRTDEAGLPVYSTNYVLTLAPLTSETNDPVAWGAVKAKTVRIVTPRPTRKGDEFELFPAE